MFERAGPNPIKGRDFPPTDRFARLNRTVRGRFLPGNRPGSAPTFGSCGGLHGVSWQGAINPWGGSSPPPTSCSWREEQWGHHPGLGVCSFSHDASPHLPCLPRCALFLHGASGMDDTTFGATDSPHGGFRAGVSRAWSILNECPTPAAPSPRFKCPFPSRDIQLPTNHASAPR